MEDMRYFHNNFVYCSKVTNLTKNKINSYNNQKTKTQIKYKKVNPKATNLLKKNNSNKKNMTKPDNTWIISHNKTLSLRNNKEKIYNYNPIPRKNILHIKTIPSEEKYYTINKNFLTEYSLPNISNVSITYITPEKTLNLYNSVYQKKYNDKYYSSYDDSNISYAKTASSSSKKIEINNRNYLKTIIKKENLFPKFNEGIRNNGRKTLNHRYHIVQVSSEKYAKEKEEKMKEVQKKNEIRHNRIKHLLQDVQKKKCNICGKLINIYLYKPHNLCHPSHIFPWIYLGDYINANNNEEIKILKIKYILNCAKEINIFNLPNDVKYCHLDIIDNTKTNLIQYFDKAFAFIETARKNKANILIHCKLGISRSTSILIAYMIKYFGFNVKKALEYIKAKRKQVNPNQGFMFQLFNFERYIRKLKNHI